MWTVNQMENVRKIVLTVISKHLHCEVEQIFYFCTFWMAFCAYWWVFWFVFKVLSYLSVRPSSLWTPLHRQFILTWMNFQYLTSQTQQRMVYPDWIHPFIEIRSAFSVLIDSFTENVMEVLKSRLASFAQSFSESNRITVKQAMKKVHHENHPCLEGNPTTTQSWVWSAQ